MVVGVQSVVDILTRAIREASAKNGSDLVPVRLDTLKDVLSILRPLVRLDAQSEELRELTPLSPEAKNARRPPSPDRLVGALQDRVHVEGRLLNSTPIKRK